VISPLAALVVAAAAVVVTTPIAIQAARRLKVLDEPRGFKVHLMPTPYLGGAAVLTGFALGTLVAGSPRQTGVIMVLALVVAMIGTIDDIRNVPPLYRVLAAAAVATVLWAAGYQWSLFGNDAANLAVTALWVIAVVNAFNLMDNIDGSAASVAATCALGIGAFALRWGNGAVAAMAFALSGACAGFLVYNLRRPARIFLGDGGSMPLGFAAAALILAAVDGGTADWTTVVPAVLLVGLPLFDTTLVIVSRIRRAEPTYRGNVDHLTHRLGTRLGSARAVSLTLVGAQAFLCALALALAELTPGYHWTTVGVGAVLGVLAIWFFDTLRWLPPAVRPDGQIIGRPVRILRVITRMNVGGPAYHVSLLSGRLDPTRYDTLLVSGKVGRSEGSFERLAEEYGARLETVNALGPQIRPLADLHAFTALVGIVRRFRPDIVHTHTAKAGLLGRAAALFVPRRRPIIVHTYHGHVLEGYFGRLQTAFYRILERAIARCTDCLVGVSQATVDDLVRLGVAPPNRFRVISLGLELDRFKRANGGDRKRFRSEVGVKDDELLLAYVGRLVPIKRVDRAIRAVAQARAAGAPVRLAVVGDGHLRRELEQLAESLQLDGHVRFLGYRSALEEVTAGCDAALLTSDNEGTPVALIEAAATGRPAVATAVGGVPEVIHDAGLLVAAGDDQGLAASIMQFAERPELRDEMGRRARTRVLERFTSERLLSDIEALYDELLSKRRQVGRRAAASG
jgi:UDP-N-acetylmuramyl pentapeptide phosphotransferase/UDP-N-acetylglucosamine-1-phosphate transferase/glycosyltransferase involved in cell wall biosynthesis